MSFRACAVGIVVLSVGAYYWAGLPGWLGYMAGALASTCNLLAWNWFCGLTGRIVVETDSPKSGTLLVFLAFLMKLPILVGFYFFAKQHGEGVASCFLSGLILVYFALAFWSLGKTRPSPSDFHG